MVITEIFKSIQGEGTRAGLPCIFVRLTGCNLRCTWCDTAYAFHGGNEICCGGRSLREWTSWPEEVRIELRWWKSRAANLYCNRKLPPLAEKLLLRATP